MDAKNPVLIKQKLLEEREKLMNKNINFKNREAKPRLHKNKVGLLSRCQNLIDIETSLAQFEK